MKEIAVFISCAAYALLVLQPMLQGARCAGPVAAPTGSTAPLTWPD
jgi:hypothetical protein